MLFNARLNSSNFLPCRGLVRPSATIFSVGIHSTETRPSSITSRNQKYLMLTCLDAGAVEPPFSKQVAAPWLSWYSMAFAFSNPSSCRSRTTHKIWVPLLLAATTSASHELLVTIFCFLEFT